jgi:hypothetical protein
MSADLSNGPRLETQALRWRSQVVKIALSASLTAQNTSIKADADVTGAVRRSLASWSAVTGIDFRLESSDKLNISPSGAAGDSVNLITIAQTPENLQVFAADPFGESARTRVFYDRRGAIIEGDIVLNPLQQFSTDGTYGTFDLETTLTHEIGHLIGLRHSLSSSSIMAERIPRNTDNYVGSRSLTETDIAAARDLYRTETDSCCGVIAGRITMGAKAAKNTTLWAEDGDGRVVALGQTDTDGSYRLGGLPGGKYSVFSLRHDGDSTLVTELGNAAVSSNDRIMLSKRISGSSSGFSIDMAGIGREPSEGALEVKAGRQYTISVAGHGLREVNASSFQFSTKSVRVDPSSFSDGSLADGRDLVTFTIVIATDALPGAYTLHAQKGDISSAIVGGFVISR